MSGAGFLHGSLTTEAAIGVRDLLVHHLTHQADAITKMATYHFCPKERAFVLVRSMAKLLQNCEIVLWDVDMHHALFGDGSWMKAWSNTTLDQSHTPLMPQLILWSESNVVSRLGTGIREITETSEDMEVLARFCFRARNYTNGKDGVVLCLVMWSSDDEDAYAPPTLRFLTNIPIGGPLVGPYLEFAAEQEFMRQKIVTREPQHLPRNYRRRLERDGHHIPAVNRIILRRRATGGSRYSTESDARSWDFRWLVRGHWRNQFHPGDGSHKPKFILPYVKGPDDKPLRLPSATIIDVKR